MPCCDIQPNLQSSEQQEREREKNTKPIEVEEKVEKASKLHTWNEHFGHGTI